MKRHGYWLISFLLLILLLTACAAPKAPAPAPPPASPAAAAPVTPSAAALKAQQLVDGARKEGEVVLWTNTLTGAETLKAAIRDKFPYLKFTTWIAPTGRDLVGRLAEEAKAGRISADIIVNSTIDNPEAEKLGLFKEYDWSRTMGWPHQPPNNLSRVITAAPRLPVYNTERVVGADIPKSWEDLKKARWQGRSIIDKAESFWRDVVRNGRPIVSRAFAPPTELLAAGEADILLAGSSVTTLEFRTRGAPVDVASVEMAMATPFAIAIVNNAPHPNAAELLADYFTSTEGLLVYANVNLQNAIDPEVEKRATAGALLKSRGVKWAPMPLELYTAENVKRSGDFWIANVERR
ncbi:MAG: transporter substrate-binding protein [Dehalococcoidia bacterium]|nr:transporter substrate-binding protein [Dehalococcoidia bacterium]